MQKDAQSQSETGGTFSCSVVKFQREHVIPLLVLAESNGTRLPLVTIVAQVAGCRDEWRMTFCITSKMKVRAKRGHWDAYRLSPGFYTTPLKVETFRKDKDFDMKSIVERLPVLGSDRVGEGGKPIVFLRLPSSFVMTSPLVSVNFSFQYHGKPITIHLLNLETLPPVTPEDKEPDIPPVQPVVLGLGLAGLAAAALSEETRPRNDTQQ